MTEDSSLDEHYATFTENNTLLTLNSSVSKRKKLTIIIVGSFMGLKLITVDKGIFKVL